VDYRKIPGWTPGVVISINDYAISDREGTMQNSGRDQPGKNRRVSRMNRGEERGKGFNNIRAFDKFKRADPY